MNDHLKISPHGLRLIQDFEGEPRVKARLCEGGAWELGWGCTYYPDNSPVKEGDTIDRAFAPVMLEHAVTVTEDAVKRLVKVQLNQNQFDGLCGFIYNVGEANAATSTVIRETNAGRFEDAAAAFGMWVFATKGGYKQALRGLLRRRYAEAATYLGYHYEPACADEAIALQRERPASLPGVDRVLYKTPFSNILRVAQKYPLGPTEPVQAKVPVPASIALDTEKVAVAPLPDSALPNLSATIDGIPVNLPLPTFEEELVLDQPAVSEGGPPDANGAEPVGPSQAGVQAPQAEHQNSDVVLSGSAERLDPIAPQPPVALPSPLPPPPLPKPVIIAPKQIDPNAADYGAVDIEKGPKNMTDSRRFVGLLIVGLGSLIQVLAARNVVTSLFGAIFFDLSRDPVVLALMAGAVIWFIGLFTKKRGGKVMTTGFVHAEQLLK